MESLRNGRVGDRAADKARAGRGRVVAGLVGMMGAGMAGGLMGGRVCVAVEPWSAVTIGPSGADSQAFGCEGAVQVGYVRVVPASGTGGAQYRAGMWLNGAGGTYVDLHVPWAASSEAFGVSGMLDGSGGTQVGGVAVAGAYHASLWRGSPESWVDLNPLGTTGSIALCTSGAEQVGYAIYGVSDHAGIWRGTAQSWVDLHPDAAFGAVHSHAVACDAGQQVGYVTFGTWHATMWTGTPESRVDLHPAAATRSECAGVSGGVQVGNVTIAGVKRAALWRGTPESLVDLHPMGAAGGLASSSAALAAAGEWQAGWATIADVVRACLWRGTAGTYEDLSGALGPDWGASYARGVWTDGRRVVVSGSATNLLTGREVAVVWRRSVCCAADFDCSGGLSPLTVTDIFEYLGAWFAGDARADFNHVGGLDVQDVFDFLGAWFTGC